MEFEIINIGSAPNDGSGDTARNAGAKLNLNFSRIAEEIESLHQVAYTGNYDDLTNKPVGGGGGASSWEELAGIPPILEEIGVVTSEASSVIAFDDAGDATTISTGDTGIQLLSADTDEDARTTLSLGSAAIADAEDFAEAVHSHSNATTSTAGFMSGADKTKLDAIPSDATNNTGTVTSVGITGANGITVSGGTITSSGTIALDINAGQLRSTLNVADGSTVGATWGTNLSSIPAAISSIAALTPSADNLPYYTGASTSALTPLTAAGRALLDDADATAQRNTLSLGTSNSPQFTGVNIGHASDTAIVRVSAGVASLAGSVITTVSNLGSQLATKAGAASRYLAVNSGNTDVVGVDPVVIGVVTNTNILDNTDVTGFFNAVEYNESLAIYNIGEIESSTHIFDGGAGINQLAEITDDVELTAAYDCLPGKRYSIRLFGGASGPHVVTLGTGFTLATGVSLPDSGNVETGETLRITFEQYQSDTHTYTEVVQAVLYTAPSNQAPSFARASLVPAQGVVNGSFSPDYKVICNPNPTSVTFKWYVNDDEQIGVTTQSASFTGADGAIEQEITVSNGVGSPAVITVESFINNPIPIIIGETNWANTTGGSSTHNFGFGALSGYVVEAGDYCIFYAAQQNTVDMTLPSGFAYLNVAGEIPRASATADNGVNYRSVVAGKVLDSTDITNGYIQASIRNASGGAITILRGANSVVWDGTYNRDNTNPYLENNSVVIPSVTLAAPALVIPITFGGNYNDNIQDLTLTNYRAGPVGTMDISNQARYGVKSFSRRRGTGAVSPGTASHGGSADSHITAITVTATGPTV